MILGFDDYEPQARALARALEMPCEIVRRHRFPDGENCLTLPDELPRRVIVCRSLDQPNEKLLELLLTAKTARRLGAEELVLVAPYLCYMRQDNAFHPGEAVSQPIVGEFLADLFETVVTVDPHLHRIERLEQAVPARRSITLSATGLMAGFLPAEHAGSVLLGPDVEAEQWVAAVSAHNQLDYGVCTKLRSGDRDVEVSLPDIDIDGRDVVLIDDIASSGQTLIEAALQCRNHGAGTIDALVTHALLDDDSLARMRSAGIRHVWSTDSISHSTNVIALDGLLADAVRALNQPG